MYVWRHAFFFLTWKFIHRCVSWSKVPMMRFPRWNKNVAFSLEICGFCVLGAPGGVSRAGVNFVRYQWSCSFIFLLRTKILQIIYKNVVLAADVFSSWHGKCVFGDHRLCLHMLDLIRKLYCLFGILCFPAKSVRLAFSVDFRCPGRIWALGWPSSRIDDFLISCYSEVMESMIWAGRA